MNKDQIQGWFREYSGKLRSGLGKAVGNRAIMLKGRVEQVIGKTQASYGNAKARFKKRL
jgi:uncharacterized protein YjbJ (UPF0337 family)